MTARADELGRWVAGALRTGTGASVALMLAGVALDLATIAWYGLLLLTLTPALQLAVAVVAFGRRREVHYALIASFVLALLLAGLAAAVVVARTIGD